MSSVASSIWTTSRTSIMPSAGFSLPTSPHCGIWAFGTPPLASWFSLGVWMSNLPEISHATKWSRTILTFASTFLNQLGGGGGVAVVGLSGTGTGWVGWAAGRVTVPVVIA